MHGHFNNDHAYYPGKEPMGTQQVDQIPNVFIKILGNIFYSCGGL